ncbi:MAG: hypothetical protein WKF57_06105 [Nakamurella sp.]
MRRPVLLTVGALAASIALSGCGTTSGSAVPPATVTVISTQAATGTPAPAKDRTITVTSKAATTNKSTVTSKVTSTVMSTVTKDRTVTVTAAAAPPAETSTQAPTQESAPGTSLAGTAKPKLSAGTPGEVSVVAQAAFTEGGLGDGSGMVPVILRNNTDETVFDLKMTATASNDGKLVGAGSDQGVSPSVVRPGEIAMGYVYFSGGETNSKSKVEISVESSSNAGYYIDIPVTTINAVGTDLVGQVSNPSSEKIGGPIRIATGCFDGDGNLLFVDTINFADKDELAPGSKSGFSVSLYDKSCPTFLVGASGNTF